MKNDLGIIDVSATPVADDSEHFELCPICGQSFDRRDLAQVMHHAAPEHQPLSPEERFRVVAAGEMLEKLAKE